MGQDECVKQEEDDQMCNVFVLLCRSVQILPHSVSMLKVSVRTCDGLDKMAAPMQWQIPEDQ